MDNQLKRITAVLCTIFLLSGCHSDIQQTQAKEDTTLQQETQEVSLQLQDEPLITEEFEGTLTFADTGDLQEEQKELINLYMKWYYDSLAKEEVEQLPDIFVSGEQAQTNRNSGLSAFGSLKSKVGFEFDRLSIYFFGRRDRRRGKWGYYGAAFGRQHAKFCPV